MAAITVATAAANATATDQTPPTEDSEVVPHRSSARNDRSMRGRTTIDIRRLTRPRPGAAAPPSNRRNGLAVTSAIDLGGVELACGDGTLADELVGGGSVAEAGAEP